MRATLYRNYMLGLLLVILAFNYVDRLALGLLLQDIKTDLDLSDTQLGLLTGIAFALFYSVMGLPIARWADRGNRVTIITVTTGLWSIAVALCGAAGSFLQLLSIRVGVAVGEAGCVPPAHSLIADYFSRAERPRAVAIYMLGAPLSALIGYFLAGWLNEIYGWRITFLLLGLPGIVLSVLTWATLREPRRADSSLGGPPQLPASAGALDILDTSRVLWSNQTFRRLLLCFSVATFFGYGVGQWKGAFFIRSYGLQTGELGTWFAAIFGLGGLLGTYLGGAWASRYAANNERMQLHVMALGYCSFGLLSACAYLSANRYMAFLCLGIAMMGGTTANGPLFAMIQSLVQPRMRAMSIALTFLFANLVGMGLGPLAVGLLSDALKSWAGSESLRYSLLALCPGYLWCAMYLWKARSSVVRDLEAAQLHEESHEIQTSKTKGPAALLPA